MKILLANVIDPSSEVETRYPHLGLAYLASSARAALPGESLEFKIIDKDYSLALSAFQPDMVCLTSVTQNFSTAGLYARLAKKRGLPVIIGGIHISALPETMTADMDIGVVGEGEKTFVELLAHYSESGSFSKEIIAEIKGIVYRNGQEIVKTSPREQIRNLDDLQFPARDLLKIGPHSYLFTSRGCPYDCAFCASTRFWSSVRYFSAGYVVREISELVELYSVKLISFFDDLFIGNRERLKGIVDLLEESGLLNKVKFTCSARANLVTDEVATLLARMKVSSVGMGLESGSDETLRYLKGGNVSVADNARAVSILAKHKIAPNASFVIGAPSETKTEMLKTYFFIKNNPLSLFDTYVLTPYPGTDVWEYAKRRNLVSDTMDWSTLNINFQLNPWNAVIVSEVMSRREIIRMYRKFQRLRFLHNVRHVWFTPQIFDLPRYALRKILEKWSRIGLFKKNGAR